MENLTKHSKFNLTDAGNAKRFVALHGQNIKYNTTKQCWLVWNGMYWIEDRSGEVERLAKDTALSIYEQTTYIMDQVSKAKTKIERDILSKESQDLAKWAKLTESKRNLNAMVSLAKSELGITISQNEFNSNIWLLNCLNGTINLRTGELQKHKRTDLLTRIVNIKYNPEATAPLFLNFLERVLPDNEVRLLLQRWIGYSLSGDVSEQCFLIFHGNGANGKSTFIDLFLSMFKDYSRQTEFRTFVEKESETIRNDIARLESARFVFATEGKYGSTLDSSTIKVMTGNDAITCRFLHKEYFEYKPEFKIILTTNHKPKIDDTSDGMWRRVLLVEWPVSLAPSERDKSLPKKLESEYEGVFAWAIRGTMQWLKSGLIPPVSVLSATDDYRNDQNDVGSWVSEYCISSKNSRTSSSELYKMYIAWCYENEIASVSQRKLSEELRYKGFSPIKGTGGKREWLGVKLDKNEKGTVVEAKVAEVAPSSVNTSKCIANENKFRTQMPLAPLEPLSPYKGDE